MRALLCGGPELLEAAQVLGLESVTTDPDVVLIDLRVPAELSPAATCGSAIPRIVIAAESRQSLARALGCALIVEVCDPAVLGPLLQRARPAAARPPTRCIVVTSPRGGVGRTLLVANLARRLADRRRVLVLDATGTGAAAWWLGVPAQSWAELEGLTGELTVDHLALVSGEVQERLRVLGGPPVMPTSALAVAATRAALAMSDLVLVDAPVLADERTRALLALADRVIALTYDDPASRGALAGAELPAGAWVIASQSPALAVEGHEVFRALPADGGSVGAAMAGARRVGGALGRAYDELAALIAVDVA